MKKQFLSSIALPFVFSAFLPFAPFSCLPSRDGGIFRSSDRGESWEQKVAISKRQGFASSDILSITADPQNSKILYAGLLNGGIFKSMDGGELWYSLIGKVSPLSKYANVYDVAVDPLNTNNVYIGTYQDHYGRLLRSQDAGKSWEEVYRVSRERYAVFAVEVDIYYPAIIYMGTAEGGLMKSIDYGTRWKVIKWFDDVINDIRVNPHNTNVVYVSTYRSGIYKTTDKGTTWQHLDNLNGRDFPGSDSIQYLLMDPKSPDVLYAGSTTGLFKTIYGGEHWQRVNIVIPPNSISVTAIALNPIYPSIIYYGAGNVIYRSEDYGLSWSVHPIATTKKIQVITIDLKDSNIVYVGMHK